MSNFMKIWLDRAESFHVDGRDEAKSPFPILQTCLIMIRS